MKTLITAISCLCLLQGCQATNDDNPPIASEAAGEEVEFEIGTVITLTGRLISTSCFGDENSENHDMSHECAVENTQKGMPVAVLEDGNPPHEAWILLTVPQIFEDYMGHTVRVTGDVRSQGVLNPTRVEWKKEDDWVFIM